jgi:hypothetical protein
MKLFITILLLPICFHGFCQQPIYFDDAAGDIYSVNLTTCTIRLIGTTSQVTSDIAFTPDGKLWGILESGALVLIDTSNASTTYIGSSTGTEHSGLVALNDSILLTIVNNTLYGIKTSNAQSFIIGQTSGYEGCGDFSWYYNDLYVTTCDHMIKIVFNDTYDKIISSTDVDNVNSQPIPFVGLVTESFNGTDSLIGISASSLYSISHIDGTYKVLCPALNNTNSAVGSACITYPHSLPIHLLNFTSSLINKTVKLQWQTASETNSNYFSVERSNDGATFSDIGMQPAAVNSNALKQYYFTDNNPFPVNYYRIKEVDRDSVASYSKILSVKMPQAESNITISPNPANDRIFIHSSQQVQKIEIINPQGVIVKTQNSVNVSQPVYISNLSNGIYFLKAYSAGGIIVSEFIKQ